VNAFSHSALAANQHSLFIQRPLPTHTRTLEMLLSAVIIKAAISLLLLVSTFQPSAEAKKTQKMKADPKLISGESDPGHLQSIFPLDKTDQKFQLMFNDSSQQLVSHCGGCYDSSKTFQVEAVLARGKLGKDKSNDFKWHLKIVHAAPGAATQTVLLVNEEHGRLLTAQGQMTADGLIQLVTADISDIRRFSFSQLWTKTRLSTDFAGDEVVTFALGQSTNPATSMYLCRCDPSVSASCSAPMFARKKDSAQFPPMVVAPGPPNPNHCVFVMRAI